MLQLISKNLELILTFQKGLFKLEIFFINLKPNPASLSRHPTQIQIDGHCYKFDGFFLNFWNFFDFIFKRFFCLLSQTFTWTFSSTSNKSMDTTFSSEIFTWKCSRGFFRFLRLKKFLIFVEFYSCRSRTISFFSFWTNFGTLRFK